MATTLQGPNGIKLILDRDDPYTPAIVEIRNPKGRQTLTSTYVCALDTGQVDDAYDINAEQQAWLERQQDAVEATIRVARRGHPEYS